MMFIFKFIALCTIFLVLLWLKKLRSVKKAIPGPFGLPILGYLPFMTKEPYKKMFELSKIYGPVYRIQLGSQNVLVLSDPSSIKEAFSNDAFIGRPPDIPVQLTKATLKAGAFTGLAFKEHRRFILHALRDLGLGKSQMEVNIKEEIEDLLHHMDSCSNSFEFYDLLASSTSNVIFSMIFGRRLQYGSEKRTNLNRNINDSNSRSSSMAWQSFFPSIKAFQKFFKFGHQGELSNVQKWIQHFCRQEINEHKKTLSSCHHSTDFMHKFLLEIEKRKNYPGSTFQDDILMDMSRIILGAGSETVLVSVQWMLLIAAAYPDVQSKIQEEIDDVLGRESFPNWQDRLKMPYTEAAICEMWRWSAIMPLNVMRYTVRDTELYGYFIPKHTKVLAVLHAALMDKQLWGPDVDDYKPERFINKQSGKVEKPEYFIPFSIGKRLCPGKILAEVEVFLYVVAILQKFKISLPPGKKPSYKGTLGILFKPIRQELVFTIRN